MTAVPERGTCLRLPLTDAPGDAAELRVLADVDRDLAPHAPTDRRWPLSLLPGACLVEVSLGSRLVLPGAWVRSGDVGTLPVTGRRRVRVEDLRMPAVVLGEGSEAVLAWGETVWPLPFDDSVAIPAVCRPDVHSLARLRRLALIALGRQEDVALTLWRDPSFEVPWHDVRLVRRARWWFAMAQVPSGMRYADAARAQGLDVGRFLAA